MTEKYKQEPPYQPKAQPPKQMSEESPMDWESPEYDEESPPSPQPKISFGFSSQVTQAQTVVKKTKPHKPIHTPVKPVHHPSHATCPPIICDPQYIIRDCYIPREVPVIHPVIHVNRRIIVNVPKHYYQPMSKNVVIDPGCPS